MDALQTVLDAARCRRDQWRMAALHAGGFDVFECLSGILECDRPERDDMALMHTVALSEVEKLPGLLRVALDSLEALQGSDGWTQDTEGVTEWIGPRVHAAVDALRQAVAA